MKSCDNFQNGLLGFLLWIFLTSTTHLAAETFYAGGLSFSDELGGFRLLSASGSGHPSDPIVLVEEIEGMGPAVLTIRSDPSNRSSTSSLSILKRSLVKVIVNKGPWRWSGFDLELQIELGQASVYSDGLSFDQTRILKRLMEADRFAAAHLQDEPWDRLRFDQGQVKPEQTLKLAFNVVDINSRSSFFLAQQPIILMAKLPKSQATAASKRILR